VGRLLSTGNLVISEISAAGPVAELMVVNRVNNPVLLMDGEKLAGAKQNRVLNTSILLEKLPKPKSRSVAQNRAEGRTPPRRSVKPSARSFWLR
jgi:hypothetical protein